MVDINGPGPRLGNDTAGDVAVWDLTMDQAAHHYNRIADYHDRIADYWKARAAWHDYAFHVHLRETVVLGACSILAFWLHWTALGIVGPALWLATR